MASRKLPNYLRRYRKLLGLSQPEVGFLLGGLTGACVSTHERYLKQPGIEGIFGYEVLFAALGRELFAGKFQEVEQTIRQRAQRLLERLARRPSRSNTRKLELLRAIASGTRPNKPYEE